MVAVCAPKVGVRRATEATDATILSTASALYDGPPLRRVYYSGFSPIPDASPGLPPIAAPLVREHRLYQADWLMRFYGFTHHEVVPAAQGGMLSLEVDPKLAWALGHPERFPVDLNTAPRELLLRVPGLGVRTVDRLLAARRVRRLRCDDLARAHVPLKKVLPFVLLADHRPGRAAHATATAAPFGRGTPVQASLFAV